MMSMGKRANIRDTRRGVETLVQQNRAAHLREQGLIAPSAGPAEAVAYDRAQAKAAFKARRRDNDASADPPFILWWCASWTALWAIVLGIALAAGSDGWTTFGGWAVAVSVVLSIVMLVNESAGADRHARRGVSP